MASVWSRLVETIRPASSRVAAAIASEPEPVPLRRGAAKLERTPAVSRVGYKAGFADPNKLYDPAYLYGTRSDVGRLFALRHTEPTIATAMDQRQDMTASLEYDIVCRDGCDTAEHIACAQAVGSVMRNLAGMTLASWVSTAIDGLETYGHRVESISVDPNGRVRLTHIEPRRIREFTQAADGYMWSRVQIDAGWGLDWLDIDRCGFWQLGGEPAQWRGISSLRSLLAPYEVEHEAVRAILDGLRAGVGTPVFRRVGAGTSADNEAIVTILENLRDGTPQPAILSQMVESSWLSAPPAALSTASEVIKTTDQRMNAAVLKNLSTLGVEGVGARALGDVVQADSQRRLERLLDRRLDVLSGDVDERGTLFGTLAELCGFERRFAPRIVIVWDARSRERSVEWGRLAFDMVQSGVVEKTPGRVAALATMAGLTDE